MSTSSGLKTTFPRYSSITNQNKILSTKVLLLIGWTLRSHQYLLETQVTSLLSPSINTPDIVTTVVVQHSNKENFPSSFLVCNSLQLVFLFGRFHGWPPILLLPHWFLLPSSEVNQWGQHHQDASFPPDPRKSRIRWWETSQDCDAGRQVFPYQTSLFNCSNSHTEEARWVPQCSLASTRKKNLQTHGFGFVGL